MMSEMKTFACQVAVGKVYPNGTGLGFTTTKGMTCLDAGSPKDMFERLINSYNSTSKAEHLVDAGDMLKMSYSVESSLYELDDFGNRLEPEYTCVKNSTQYKQLLGHIPCVFIYCTMARRWFFFSFKLNRALGEGEIIPHVVSDLVSTVDVTPKVKALRCAPTASAGIVF